MNKVKRFIVLFLIVFLLSSSLSFFLVTRPRSLKNFDGSLLKQTAVSELGNDGGEKYWKWYGFDKPTDWCACFVSWCLDKCYDEPPKFASCSQFLRWFKENRRLYSPNTDPMPGMIIFFDWADNGQDGVSDHVGIVASVENGTVHTIEGNSGDACRERSYSVGYYEILGYGVLQVGGETDNSNNETPTQ